MKQVFTFYLPLTFLAYFAMLLVLPFPVALFLEACLACYIPIDWAYDAEAYTIMVDLE